MLRNTHFGARAWDFLWLYVFLYGFYMVLGKFEGLGFLTSDFLTSVRGVVVVVVVVVVAQRHVKKHAFCGQGLGFLRCFM